MATKKTVKKAKKEAAPKATKKAVKKKTAAKKKTAKPASEAKKKTTKKAATKKTTAKKVAKKSAAGKTKVTAKVDVGWGNSLFVRGDGPGLSWDEGVLMECSNSNSWLWETSSAKADFTVKFLINDDHWSSGDNLEVKAGKSQTTIPEFFG